MTDSLKLWEISWFCFAVKNVCRRNAAPESFITKYRTCHVNLHKVRCFLKKNPEYVYKLGVCDVFVCCIQLSNEELSWSSKLHTLHNAFVATSELLAWLSTLGG